MSASSLSLAPSSVRTRPLTSRCDSNIPAFGGGQVGLCRPCCQRGLALGSTLTTTEGLCDAVNQATEDWLGGNRPRLLRLQADHETNTPIQASNHRMA
jgi:hypothetical protein